MGNQILLFLAILAFSISSAQKSSVVGKWKTIDDATGKPISVVEIYEKNGKYYGKVDEVLDPSSKDKTCTKCLGADKGAPIVGLVVIKGLKKDGHEYSGGEILDPKHGKLYKCYIKLESANKLKVRGFIGFSLFGRTQYWHRVN